MKLVIELNENDDQKLVDRILTALQSPGVTAEIEPAPVPAEIEPAPAELDNRDLPWDERIHSAGKTLNANGTWRQKRGVDADLVAAVEQEWIDTKPDTPPAPPPPANDTPPAPPPPAPLSEQVTDDNNATFADLMLLVSKLKADGNLSQDQFVSLYVPHGLASFAALSTRPDLIPTVMKEVRAYVS